MSQKKNKTNKLIITIILIILISIITYINENIEYRQNDKQSSATGIAVNIENIPEYNENIYIEINNNKLDMPDVIRKSLAIISELTDYTSVVLGSKSNLNKLQKVEVLPLMDSKLIAIIVTDKGHVEHRNISISGVSIEEVQKTVELINKLLIGTPIDEINKKLEFEVKPIINQYVVQHKIIYDAFYNVFSDMVSKNDMSFVGKNNILNQPEFNNVEKIKNLLNKFEDSSLFESIEEDDNDINIYIGKESKLDDDVTVIKTKYKTATDEGTIAVIGPKRMEYDRVVSLLGYIKEHLK